MEVRTSNRASFVSRCIRATSSCAPEKSGAAIAVVGGGIVRVAHAVSATEATMDTSE
jgi:hypothetical protein